MKKHFLVATVIITAMATMDAAEWRLLLPRMTFTMRVNPHDSQKLVVGGWSNQLYKSADGGKTWVTKEVGSLSSGNSLTSVIISSKDTSVIVCAGFLFSGIKRSSDGGDTWEQVLIDTSLRRMWFISEALLEDAKDPNIMYAGRSSVFNSVWKSTNSGATWDSIGVISTDYTGRICTIAQRYDSTNILFAGCKGGQIIRSDDGGVTWAPTLVNDQKDTIRPDSEIPKIVFSLRDPQVGYAIVAIADYLAIPGNGGVLKTTDGGASWNHVAFVDTSFWAVDSRPLPSGTDDEVFIGGFRISNIPTTVKGDSLIYRSGDGGSTWERYESIPWGLNEIQDSLRNAWAIRCDTLTDKVYMATEVGLYVLDDETSVNEEATIASDGLSVTSTADALVIHDTKPSPLDKVWAIYAMDGTRLSTGAIDQQAAQAIPIGALPSGRYLLTWGSDAMIRTALFTIIR